MNTSTPAPVDQRDYMLQLAKDEISYLHRICLEHIPQDHDEEVFANIDAAVDRLEFYLLSSQIK